MKHEMAGEPVHVGALYVAIDDAAAPPGPLSWDRVLRDVWFGVDHDPDAPVPQEDVDLIPPAKP